MGCGMADVVRIRAGGCPYVGRGLGSVTFPVLRILGPGWEENAARRPGK